MEGFDPLFDEDLSTQAPFSLSLPTFEYPPPSSAVSGENDRHDFFDQNVGTIALLGSHDSEHPQASSSIAPGPSGSKATSKKRTRSQKQISKPSATSQVQRPYVPESVHDIVLGQLAKDPNVVPLLQAIVEYVYKTNLAPAQSRLVKTSPTPAANDVRPIKRRRLQRVPAGAEGWTVPFPFPQGEGPQHYRETWEMKRLIVLLGSLIRNLKDWRGQHGTVSFNTQPRKRTFRKKQSSSETPSPSPAPIAQSANDSSLDESFLSQLQIPNPSEFDMSLEALLNVLASYEGNNESALNLNLGALSVGAPISDILFATSADAEQTVPWENYTTFFSDPPMSSTTSQITSPANQTAFSGSQMEVDPPSMNMSMYQMDITPLDTPDLSRGSKRSIEPSASFRDEYDCTTAVDQQLPFSGLGLNFAAPQGTHVQEDGIPDEELQELLNMVLSSSTPDPSMTDSPSVATPMDIATPHMSAYKQPNDLTATPASTLLTLTPRVVAAVSKRGKGRTTAAISRDLNKQLRQNPVEGVVSSPGSVSVTPAPLPPAGGVAKKAKKMRASDTTIEARQETLERAKEWREVMAKELERARTARWEVMMEGLVLREIGVLVRNEGSGSSAIEIDK
jgi:hypothetical protein